MSDVAVVEITDDEHSDETRNPNNLAGGTPRAEGEQLELDDEQIVQMEILETMPAIESDEFTDDEHSDERRNPERLTWFRRLMHYIRGTPRADGEQLEYEDKLVDEMEISKVQKKLEQRQLDTTGSEPDLKARLKEAYAAGRKYRSQACKQDEINLRNIESAKLKYCLIGVGVTDTDWEKFYQPVGMLKVTLVHIAARTGDLLMLRHADEANLNLNAEDLRGKRAMHYAAFEGHKHVVKWLLDNPDTHDQLLHLDHQGDSPLHSAILGLHDEYADCLEGIIKDWRYMHPDISCRQNVDVVELLLYEGAKVNFMNNFGFSPLFTLGHVLTIHGGPRKVSLYEKLFKILVNASAASVHTKPDQQNTTVLYHAVQLGSIEVTRHLIESGFCIVINEYENTSILHSAARCKSHEILDILLKTCSDIDSCFFGQSDHYGMTPLHYAAKTGHVENFSTLIRYGANPLTKNSEGMTAFDVLFEERSDPTAYLTDILDLKVDFVTCGDFQGSILNFDLLQHPDVAELDVILILINAARNMQEKVFVLHPLVETFLELKRSGFRYFFFILYMLHTCFLLFLFWYAIVLLQNDAGSSWPRRLLLLCAFILLAHNVIQVLATPNFGGKTYKMGLHSMYNSCCNYYDRHFGHWLSIICELMSIGIAVAGEFIPEVMTTMQSKPWLLNSFGIVIILAGIQMTLIIGTYRSYGYYILIFVAVLKNVLNVFLVFVSLILSFAFSFMILFRDENQFHDPWVAVVKTVAMMTGEYDYSALLNTTNKDNSTGNNSDSKKTSLPIIGGIIFLMFVILATIVMMNFITALAVTEDVIAAFAKRAELAGLIKQVEFVAHFDRMATLCRFKWMKTEISPMIWVVEETPYNTRKHDDSFIYYISKDLMKKFFIVDERKLMSNERTETSLSSEEPEDDPTDIHSEKKSGDSEPVILPTANAILELKYDQHYSESIKDIGMDPFFVYYWSGAQTHAYREYCKQTEHSKVCFGATGSVVQNIIKTGHQKTSEIFLYEGIVYDKAAGHSFTVCNMLSERHNNATISTWLSTWLRDNVPPPREVCCDQSVALLSAVVQSFTQYSNLETYLNVCCTLLSEDAAVDIPECFVRCEAAHFMKLVTSSAPLKTVAPRVKKVYVRAIGKLVQSTSVTELREIILTIFTVALSETDGTNTTNGEPTRAQVQKQNILNFESTGFVQKDEDAVVEDEYLQQLDSLGNYNNDFVTLAQTIANNCIAQMETGNEINPLYLPAIVPFLVKAMKLLPLWSAVMVPLFGYGDTTASSAAVESSFNKTKNNIFKNNELPTRADNFITTHLESLRSWMKLLAAPRSDIRGIVTVGDTATKLNEITDCTTEEVDNTNLSTPKKKFNLPMLKNGGRSHDLEVVAIKSIGKVVLTNTCAFDSLTSILCCAYADSPKYSARIDEIVNGDAYLGLIQNLVRDGVTTDTYPERAKILIDYCKYPTETIRDDNTTVITCQSTISSLIHCILPNHPTTQEEINCSDTSCKNHKTTCAPLHIIKHTTSDASLQDLTEKVKDHLKGTEEICGSVESDGPPCTGLKQTTVKLSSPHLFIEILHFKEVPGPKPSSDVAPQLKVKLDDIPKQITHDDTVFELRGAVAHHFSGTASHDTVGHYTAYCKRGSGDDWELFDDTLNESSLVEKSALVPCELLVYTI